MDIFMYGNKVGWRYFENINVILRYFCMFLDNNSAVLIVFDIEFTSVHESFRGFFTRLVRFR